MSLNVRISCGSTEGVTDLLKLLIRDSACGAWVDCENTSDSIDSIVKRLVSETEDGLALNVCGCLDVTPESYGEWWDDLRVSAEQVRIQGSSNIPGWGVLSNDGSSSAGVYALWFDDNTLEQVFFSVQIPHAVKLGSELHPHVHFVPENNGATGATVVWGLEYVFADIGETFGLTNIIYTDSHYPADAVLAADKHYVSSFEPIEMQNDGVSGMILCRLFRSPAGGGGFTDDYAHDAGLLEFDFHVIMDTPGSEEELVK